MADRQPRLRWSVGSEVVNWSQELNHHDSKGEFSIKSVPPGSYVLSAQQTRPGQTLHDWMKLNVGEEKVDSLCSFGRGVTIMAHHCGFRRACLDRAHCALICR